MSCPGRMVLVRRALGELSREERASIDEHAAGCLACQSLCDEIAVNLEIYEPKRQAAFARLTANLPDPTRPRRWLGWVLVPAMAAAAALALVVWPAEEISFKGAFAMKIVAKRADTQILVRDGQQLRAGDALRFLVTTDSPGYVTIVLVDTAGEVWPFYPDTDPEEDPQPWHIDGAGQHELPDSIAMDASTGDEQIIALFSPVSFDRATAHRRLADLDSGVTAAALGVPAGIVKVVRVHKAEGP